MRNIICRTIKTERYRNGKIQPVEMLAFFWEDTKQRVNCVGCYTIDKAREYAENNIPCQVDFSQWFKNLA
jgi:hypothetical protein